MMIKTSELTGPALDWAAAICAGGIDFRYDTIGTYWITIDGKDRALGSGWAQSYEPSKNPKQCWEIIEVEGIHARPCYDNGNRRTGADAWRADIDFMDGVMTLGKFTQYGETALIAALRCRVASKLGDEVDVPEELL